MGCLESCFKKTEDGPNERTSLLNNDHNPSANSVPVNAQLPREETPVGSLSRSLQDEQSLLNGILSKYSSDVVDITSIDSRIDAVEYMNRVQLYQRKLAALGGGLEIPKPSLRSACSNPAALLGGPTPAFDDIMLISEISDNIARAFLDVKVIRKDHLTVDLAQR